MKNAIYTIYEVLNNVDIEIKEELKEKLKQEFGKNTFSLTISRGNIKNFRNYIWINIEDIENEKFYSINLFYNYIILKLLYLVMITLRIVKKLKISANLIKAVWSTALFFIICQTILHYFFSKD